MNAAAARRADDADDAAAAPLLTIQKVALTAAAEPGWSVAIPPLENTRLDEGIPLLHDRVLTPRAADLDRLASQLASQAGRVGASAADGLVGALERGALDPFAWAEAALAQDPARTAALADDAATDEALLAALGHHLVLPLCRALGQAATPLLADARWEAGFCPVCAGWPILVEQRGLERERWPRCGRCGGGWRHPHMHCVFCASDDHRAQGYLAPEADRASRRAVTCDVCCGYVKMVAAIGPTPPDDLFALDLATVELDLAALARGYGRPAGLGFPLNVRLEPAPKRGWLAAWTRRG